MRDGGDRAQGFDQVSVQLYARHGRHVNIRDQAVGCSEPWRLQKLLRGLESRYRVAQCLEQPAHRIEKRRVVVDDRDQGWFGQRFSDAVIPLHAKHRIVTVPKH